MKTMKCLTALVLLASMNALASQTIITGRLVENKSVEGFGNGFQVISDTIYNLEIPGNTCGRAYTVFQLEDAVGSIVELTGDADESTLKTGCGIQTESFIFSLNRGDNLKVLEPAPAPAPAQ